MHSDKRNQSLVNYDHVNFISCLEHVKYQSKDKVSRLSLTNYLNKIPVNDE